MARQRIPADIFPEPAKARKKPARKPSTPRAPRKPAGPRSPGGKRPGPGIRRIALWAVGLLLVLGAADVGRYFVWPDVSRLARENPATTAFMERRREVLRAEGKPDKLSYSYVPLSRIAPALVRAVLIAEDDRFFTHEGFDFDAMAEALEKDLKARSFRYGASTVTQQLAKNLWLTPSKNPLRKLKEAILTWRLERELSKKRIIELYLNVAQWGGTVYGIEAASRHWYGKSAAALTAREASRLAVVLPNPVRFTPTGPSKYVAARSRVVYEILRRRGLAPEGD